MGLKEEIKPIIGNRRKFFLLRVAEVDVSTARGICGISKGTYNSWLRDPVFVSLYRRRGEFSSDYKQEAIQLLRRNTQLAAALLEEQIIKRMKEEIDSGEYSLLKTNLAREVYTKLISELDTVPQTKSVSWIDRVTGLIERPPDQITQGGEDINGEVITEATGSPKTEHTKSITVTESK